jgi:nucleoside diphosphate kinase
MNPTGNWTTSPHRSAWPTCIDCSRPSADVEQNAIHGSDSDENAKIEIAFFFAESELI